MNQPNKKKNLLLIALLAVALAAAGVCFAVEDTTDAAAPQSPTPPAANPAEPPPPPPAMHPRGPKRHGLSPEMRQKVDAFMRESKPLRRQLFVAETALKAQSRAAQPNDALIRELAGQIFDLKDELKAKARASGVPPMLIKALTGRPDIARGGHGKGPHGKRHPGMGHHHRHHPPMPGCRMMGRGHGPDMDTASCPCRGHERGARGGHHRPCR